MNAKREETLRIHGLLTLLAMALVLAAGLGICTSQIHAADGNYSLKVQYSTMAEYSPGTLESDPATEITLYRVGDCAKDLETGKWDKITLAEGLGNITLTQDEIKARNSGTQTERIQAWLDKAATIDNWIQSNPGLQEELKARTTSGNPLSFSGNGSMTFTGLDQGLYLLHASSNWVRGDSKFWCPQPMLVQIVAAGAEANLKPVSREDVDEITLLKAWNDEDENARPESVSVQLAYDGEPQGEPVVLSEENNWTQTVKTAEGKRNPLLWSAAEVKIISGYTPEIRVSEVVNGKMTLSITNSVTPPEYDSLKLVKEVPVYVDHGDGVSTTFTFEITGYQGSNEAYRRIAGLQFDKNGSKDLIIDTVPRGLTKLVVREIASANYTPEGGAEKEAVLEGDVYTVSFRNIYDETTHYEGGVINKYKQTGGKYRFDFREGIVKQ